MPKAGDLQPGADLSEKAIPPLQRLRFTRPGRAKKKITKKKLKKFSIS